MRSTPVARSSAPRVSILTADQEDGARLASVVPHRALGAFERPATDRELFAYSLDPAQMMLRFNKPDEDQARVVRCDGDQLVMGHRQWGKSSVVAIRELWRMYFDPPWFCIFLSVTQRQAGELFKKARQYHKPFRHTWPADIDTAMHLWLKNGSRLLALPAKPDSIVGYSAVDELVIDEAARTRTELLNHASPMLSTTDGSICAMTTPKDRLGWFWDYWSAGGSVPEEEADSILKDAWTRTRVPAPRTVERGRIKQSFLDKELTRMGRKRFAQDYLVEFTGERGLANQPFRPEAVQAAKKDGTQRWF